MQVFSNQCRTTCTLRTDRGSKRNLYCCISIFRALDVKVSLLLKYLNQLRTYIFGKLSKACVDLIQSILPKYVAGLFPRSTVKYASASIAIFSGRYERNFVLLQKVL